MFKRVKGFSTFYGVKNSERWVENFPLNKKITLKKTKSK